MRRLAGLVIASLCLVQAAPAADLYSPRPSTAMVVQAAPAQSWRVLDEVRLGVFAHDPDSPESGSADINGEILTSRLPFGDPASGWHWLVPRLHVGATINTGSKTSHGYAGLTWTVDLTRWAFIEGSFGGAVHNGKTGLVVPAGHNPLGCSPMFRESGSLGFRLTGNWSVMATVEHLSNAGLCDRNRGLTNYGARIGYRF